MEGFVELLDGVFGTPMRVIKDWATEPLKNKQHKRELERLETEAELERKKSKKDAKKLLKIEEKLKKLRTEEARENAELQIRIRNCHKIN